MRLIDIAKAINAALKALMRKTESTLKDVDSSAPCKKYCHSPVGKQKSHILIISLANTRQQIPQWKSVAARAAIASVVIGADLGAAMCVCFAFVNILAFLLIVRRNYEARIACADVAFHVELRVSHVHAVLLTTSSRFRSALAVAVC